MMRFDGREYAKKIYADLEVRVENLKKSGINPTLVWIAVGEDEASGIYGRLKEKAAKSVGIDFRSVLVEAGNEVFLREKVLEAAQDDLVHGVMVQLPVGGIAWENTLDILNLIPLEKDVDGLSPENMGRLVSGSSCFLPATVGAVSYALAQALDWSIRPGRIEDFNDLEKPLGGKRVAVIGGGWEVGKGLVNLYSNWGATVIWARSRESNLKELCLLSDIVISATGVANLIKNDYVKHDAIVIDVGSPNSEVEPEVEQKAMFLTPVPGGIGPVTVACLMANVVRAGESGRAG